MKLSNAVKKLAKYGKVHNMDSQYFVKINKHFVGFLVNGGTEKLEDRSIVCKYIQKVNDQSDSSSDYCAKSFFSTLTSALKYAASSL